MSTTFGVNVLTFRQRQSHNLCDGGSNKCTVYLVAISLLLVLYASNVRGSGGTESEDPAILRPPEAADFDQKSAYGAIVYQIRSHSAMTATSRVPAPALNSSPALKSP